MALGSEVKYSVDVVALEDTLDGGGIGDIGVLKAVVGRLGHLGDIVEIAGIGEGVDVDDEVVGIFVDQMHHQVGADKSGASGDHYFACVVHCQ